MAVKQLPKISDLPEPPDRLVGDQERFDVLTFNSLKAQKKMVNEDLNKTLIPALNQFAVDVNASVDAAAQSERNAHDSEEVAKTKAGEAAGSAGAAKVSEDNAKVSETNALASKNAASSSATAAANAQKAAEAARDEAQDLANVGYASESHAGLAKVDGKTTRADAGGMITVKDVAIGGDSSDLASARGQVGDLKIATATNYPSILTICKSCRLYFNGTEWGKVADRPFEAGYGAVVIADVSSDALRGEIWAFSLSGNDAWKAQFNEKGTSPFARFVMSNAIGDGIRVTNGIISVPEMQGATASTSGTSGLVPPAAAGQHESFLTGSGEYKPALTKISDSVSLADSTTAASSKAINVVYDDIPAVAAHAAMPSSRYISIALRLNTVLEYTAVADGFIFIRLVSTTNGRVYCERNNDPDDMLSQNVPITSSLENTGGTGNVIFQVKSGERVLYAAYGSAASVENAIIARFYYAEGSGS